MGIFSVDKIKKYILFKNTILWKAFQFVNLLEAPKPITLKD